MQTEAVIPTGQSTRTKAPDFSTDEARYQAVRARDARADGHFFYAVATTGVYCRPTCAARLALRKNLGFHRTADDAERAGYRACKRCQPRGPSPAERVAEIIASARARLEAAEAPVGLAALAGSAGLSPHHFHRLFKQRVGMTPRQYAAARRLQRVEEELRDGATVTTAIHEAGYSSSSRFYQAESAALGMRPSALRRGAAGVEIRAVVVPCALGRVLVAATSRGVCAIAFGDEDESLLEDLRRRFPRATFLPSDAGLAALARRVVQLVDAPGAPTDIPFDLMGTVFQQKIWRALRDIPPGATATYGEIARRVGAAGASRTVGTACGLNPLALIVPCHRVVRGDGALGGYRWGLERKRALLARERPAERANAFGTPRAGGDPPGAKGSKSGKSGRSRKPGKSGKPSENRKPSKNDKTHENGIHRGNGAPGAARTPRP
jgi:AraC family transcriptional regulator of adaptative response/methylated-DNA-[protein]-cysteine methyltransferase